LARVFVFIQVPAVIKIENRQSKFWGLSDIYLMASIDMQTKPCPFCAETIQAAAVKCRFCGEFLNTEKAKALQADPETDPESAEQEEIDDNILFAGRPSLLGMAPL
jgi:hypothetical protein